MKKFLVVPLMALAMSTSVVAEETAIDEMFRVMEMDKQMSGGFEAMLPVLDQMSARMQLNAQEKEELKSIFRTWFDKDIDRDMLIKQFKGLYLEHFTEAEIKEVTRFYQTPVGQKFLAKSHQLMQIAAQISMQEAQSKQGLLMERVKVLMEKRKAQP